MRNPWKFAAVGLAVLAIAAVALVLALGGGDEAEAQTVRFQAPTEKGPDPFTRRTDVHGEKRIKVGSGPYGGTGTDLVCDRELLIRSLRARPERLRAWARVQDIEPTTAVVARYIRKLRPVTLVTDTRVTNHSFVDGGPTAYQAILQAGTTVLVDEEGVPRARCRCGNPLLEAVYVAEARCLACPPNYRPPPPCDHPERCWRRYPDPPPVKRFGPRPDTDDTFEEPPPQRAEPQGVPAASFSPLVGGPDDTYTISFRNFPPGEPVNIHLVRPDGVEEDYDARAGSDGSGSFTFPRAGNPVPGTYSATVANGQRIASAQTTVRGGGSPEPENPPGPEVGGGTDCNNPRSQDEIDLCSGNVPEGTP